VNAAWLILDAPTAAQATDAPTSVANLDRFRRPDLLHRSGRRAKDRALGERRHLAGTRLVRTHPGIGGLEPANLTDLGGVLYSRRTRDSGDRALEDRRDNRHTRSARPIPACPRSSRRSAARRGCGRAARAPVNGPADVGFTFTCALMANAPEVPVSVTLSRAATETNVSVANLLTDIPRRPGRRAGAAGTGRHRTSPRRPRAIVSVLHRCGPEIVSDSPRRRARPRFTEGQAHPRT